MTWAKGSMLTAHGLVTTSWTLDEQTFTLDCTVPMNATATVILPASNAQAVAEGGKSLSQVKDIVIQTKDVPEGETILSIGSGSYHFTCPR